MTRTRIRGSQVLDRSIDNDDIDTTTAGKALISRIAAGPGIELTSTGVDSGTGHVTIGVSSTLAVDLQLDENGFSLHVQPVRVKAAAIQNVAGTTNTKVVFGTVDVDPGNNWTTASNRYTAPAAGLYAVQAAMRISSSRAGKMMMYKNGVFYCNLCDYSAGTQNGTVFTGGSMVPMALGDYLEIWFYASTAVVIQPTDAYCCINRLK